MKWGHHHQKSEGQRGSPKGMPGGRWRRHIMRTTTSHFLFSQFYHNLIFHIFSFLLKIIVFSKTSKTRVNSTRFQAIQTNFRGLGAFFNDFLTIKFYNIFIINYLYFIIISIFLFFSFLLSTALCQIFDFAAHTICNVFLVRTLSHIPNSRPKHKQNKGMEKIEKHPPMDTS